MIGRVLVSLAAVLGVMWVIARRVRKSGGGGKNATRVIEVLDRTSLSKSASVAVVRVGDRALVLGVADAQVSVLGETDLGAARKAQAAAGPGKRAAHRTVRVPAEALEAPVVAPQRQDTPPAAPQRGQEPAGALAGSALSPQTWKQTIESLRDLTSRT